MPKDFYLCHIIHFLWNTNVRLWMIHSKWLSKAVWLGFSSYMVRARETYFNEQGKRATRAHVISHRWPPGPSREGQRGLNRSYNEPAGCCYEDLLHNSMQTWLTTTSDQHSSIKMLCCAKLRFFARRIATLLFQAASYKY